MKTEEAVLWHDKTIFVLLVLLVSLIPLLMNPYNLANFEPIKLAALKIIAAFVFAVWGAKIVEVSHLEFKYSSLKLPIIFLLAFMSLSTILSINHHLSFFGKLWRYEGLLTVILYIFVYWTAVNFVRERRQTNILIGSLFVSSLIICAYGIAQHFGYDFMIWSPHMDVARSASTFGNPVFFGSYLTLVLPVAITTSVSSDNISLRILAAFTFVLGFACLLFTYTRAAWLGFGISLVFMSPFLLKKLWENKRTLVAALSLVVIAGLLVALPSPEEIAGRRARSVTERVEEATQAAGTVATRIYIWKLSLRATKDKPLLGFGPETFEHIYFKYRTRDWLRHLGEGPPMDKAHNQLLQLASTTGLLGLVAYLWLIIVFLWRQTKVCFLKSQLNGEDAPPHFLFLGLVAAVLGYQIQNLANINVVSCAPVFWAFLGLATAVASNQLRDNQLKTVSVDLGIDNLEPSNSQFVRILVHIILIAIMVVSTIFSLRPLFAEYYIQRGMANVAVGRHDQAAIDYQKATQLNSSEPHYWILLGVAYLGGFRSNKSVFTFDQARTAFEQARNLDPLDEDPYFNLAALYQSGGELLQNPNLIDIAIENFDMTLHLNPYDFESRFYLGQAYSDRLQYDQAISEMKKSIAINPKESQTYLNLGVIYQKMGQKQKAEQYYQKALDIDPDYDKAREALETLKQ